jgi:hypothetical protein
LTETAGTDGARGRRFVAVPACAAMRGLVPVCFVHQELELELELIHTQMAQKQILRAEVYARALRESKNV